MRKAIAILMLIGLVAGLMSAPAGAAKKKKPTVRTFEARYENPAFGVGGVVGGCSGCPSVPTGENEFFAMIFIEDDYSPSGYVSFNYDSDGDGFENPGSGPDVCGSTEEPVAVEPGTSYTAWPWMVGTGCRGSASVSGTIKVLLSSDEDAVKKAASKL
ncbi:MAG: hypothetical protein M3277_02885 [Actinomycetota bacterium]|nr:hypothetical protein [Actinomycetota bacterium]